MLARRPIRVALLLACAMLALTVVARAEDSGGDAAPTPAAPGGAAEAEAPGTEGGSRGRGGEEQPPEGPHEVKVGVHVNDIQSLDLRTHSYAMDLWVWFRWKDADMDPAAAMEFLNPSELWGHMVTPNYEEPEELPSGELYQVVRVQGRFSKKLPLYNYPFDRQTLQVVFEDSVDEAAKMVFVVDEGSPTLDPKLQLPGFQIGTPTLAIAPHTYPTRFGDTSTATASTYSRATLEIPISRPPLTYGIKLLLPVVCVILCAALMFVLAPSHVDSRVDVGITSLLTIVALQMTFNDNLPDVGYLMLMDKVYLCSYLFVIAGLAVVVHTTRMVERGEESRALGVHRRALGTVAGAWALAMVVLISAAVKAG